MPSEAEITTSDPSPDEALLPVFSSSNHDAEMEAMTIRSILEASGIPAVVVGPQVLPSLEFQVQVPEHMLVQAQSVIDDARAAGPQAALEAELAGEALDPEVGTPGDLPRRPRAIHST
ncbi:MAG: hypothetical protein M3N54_08680 [Acidobacteriota bacterium]|nr:hypothetical protein [Acidobacteriota bacterium]